ATPETRAEFLNSRWIEYTGIQASEQMGYNWTSQIHPDDIDSLLSKWRQAAAEGAEFQIYCRVRRHDGVYRWFDNRAAPLKNEKGSIVLWVGATADVNEAYSARVALAENEERLRYVELATHDSIYDWDMRNGVTRRNEAFQKLYGAPEFAHNSERWWERHIHPDDRKRVVDSAAAAFRARRATWHDEYRLLRKDGTYAVVVDRGYLLYDANRKPLRMIGAIADITEREHTEQSLRDAQARLISALEGGRMATWIWDIPTDEMVWDDAAYRLWGRTKDEMGRISIASTVELIHPDDRPQIQAAIAEFFRTGVDTIVEFRTVRPDKALQWLQVRGQVERDAAGKPIRMAGVYIDVTQRKREEEAQLRAQKMEALGTLAGGIAHDFNNILLAISGNAKLAIDELQEDLPRDHPVRRNLAEIEKASARAADLVRRILTFSRQQEGQREVQALRPIVEDALRLLRPTLPANIEIHASYADDVAPVATDAIEVQQVVMNLVTNAAHAIGDHRGSVEVGLSTATITPDTSHSIEDLPPGRYSCLTVRDTGAGIDAAIIDRIFDPFFTTKQAGQGTGLGLAVVHGIAKAHGGAITVSSEIGSGTVFRVYLPAAEGASATPEVTLRAPIRGAGERVLYVDDEEALVFLTARVLERLGYRVTGFIDPQQALDELIAHPNNFDVLVTDLSMRGMNGFELARGARRVRHDLPILLTSGYLRTEDRETAQQCGIRELILKPNTVEELGHSIDRVLRELRER
ncbi:MAG TPA: PAS domain-containing protein, partial [Steroidobacteraceae bacterium]|nr:PAS domain-containing protein [Steroidobacteraceae bacterium]